ncbi:BnaA03g11560D [Brassica napus]|nr:unnamed protein product [Brassica napus]CDY36730.1 BnaA03g11560D [Brassica napus]
MWYWSMRSPLSSMPQSIFIGSYFQKHPEGGRLSDLTLFFGRGVLALLLELDHFAPLKADTGLTTVRQHGGVKKIESIPLSELNPYVLSSLPRLYTLQRRHTMVEL